MAKCAHWIWFSEFMTYALNRCATAQINVLNGMMISWIHILKCKNSFNIYSMSWTYISYENWTICWNRFPMQIISYVHRPHQQQFRLISYLNLNSYCALAVWYKEKSSKLLRWLKWFCGKFYAWCLRHNLIMFHSFQMNP